MESTTQTLEAEKGAVGGAARLIRRVKRATRRRFTAEEKVKIVLEGFRKELPVSDICRREKISAAVYYKWSKEFLEAGKERFKGDTLRDATKDEVDRLKQENQELKELVGDQALELALLKKRLLL